ncbi:membrane associated rhomboid family serine protease [Dysgonomonas hofstadii]|uniref:Membrane associated rhomboid family serine protease n=1 Tax=Dysgonomonas hofstadii TaxID=637886 RepID=A0A840D100_9BACT|nr:rhomboid family intramembrane serine protease [Dysgonomonas hofstadii]MBB4037993.1 membrane associated rhomboid family serine protease [Dysgonomonas hofstadii]
MDLSIEKIIPIIIIALTAITSIKGFNDMAFFDRYKFNVGAILGSQKQWDRLLTSSTLHGDYMHLIFNMLTLYFFSDIIIYSFGIWQYLLIYFLAIIGGGLLSLWVHRREYYYSAIGASGGVVGILFAAIAIDPTIGIYFFFIPIPIPGWIFALVYLGYSIYGMHNQLGNIGHDAHLGGAAVGLILAILIEPVLIQINTLYIAIMIIPLVVLAYLVLKKK